MIRILVIEDDDDLQFLYHTMLARQGYDVVTTANTSDGILRLTSEEYDLVILDMNMPDLPGIRVIEFAREDVRLRRIPIVVVSANDHWDTAVAALGVPHFMVKPITLRELVEKIEMVLADKESTG
ncbi:MAG: response regulator [Anaerolineae bacterium]|nr:response regulator [Anaerolineae bacterium]